jgi:hypothetical protein
VDKGLLNLVEPADRFSNITKLPTLPAKGIPDILTPTELFKFLPLNPSKP